MTAWQVNAEGTDNEQHTVRVISNGRTETERSYAGSTTIAAVFADIEPVLARLGISNAVIRSDTGDVIDESDGQKPISEFGDIEVSAKVQAG